MYWGPPGVLQHVLLYLVPAQSCEIRTIIIYTSRSEASDGGMRRPAQCRTGMKLGRSRVCVCPGVLARKPMHGAALLAGLWEAGSWGKINTQDMGKSNSGNLYASSSVLTNPHQTESNNKK